MFKVYLKDNIGNEISQIITQVPKEIEVDTLQIVNNCFLQKGKYLIPITNILFIKEET